MLSFDPYNNKDVFAAKYTFAKHFNGKKTVSPWENDVSTDTENVTLLVLAYSFILQVIFKKRIRCEFANHS